MSLLSSVLILKMLWLASVDTETGSCRWHGSLYVEGVCLLYNSSTMTYDAAQTFCSSIGGDLAKISSSNQLNAIASLGEQYDSIWIGATDRAEEGVWRWEATGALATELSGLWDEDYHQPDNEMNKDNCADILVTSCFSGRVWDDPCDLVYSFVCMDQAATTTTTMITTADTNTYETALTTKTATPPVTCRWAGSVDVDGGCFLYNSTKLTYDAAKDFCLSIGGVLATITTSTQVTLITASARADDSMWIGANDKEVEGTWRWEDDGALATELSALWDPGYGQPDNLKNDDCADIFITSCDDRAVWDDPCTDEFGFICMEKDIATTTKTTTKTSGTETSTINISSTASEAPTMTANTTSTATASTIAKTASTTPTTTRRQATTPSNLTTLSAYLLSTTKSTTLTLGDKLNTFTKSANQRTTTAEHNGVEVMVSRCNLISLYHFIVFIKLTNVI